MRTSLRCAVGLAVATVLASVTSATAQTVTLRYAHPNPPSSAPAQQAALFTKLAEEKTKGAVKVQLFPSSQLGSLQEMAEAVSSGAIQIHHNTMGRLGDVAALVALRQFPPP